APEGGKRPNFCPNCGTKNEGANFCPNCGQKLA
ncbi:zinc ribbon domain-containing protein, partial [Paenibacillus macerans]|nr:zinc ribbon domain-containing protein [Paenibacillus macerans]